MAPSAFGPFRRWTKRGNRPHSDGRLLLPGRVAKRSAARARTSKKCWTCGGRLLGSATTGRDHRAGPVSPILGGGFRRVVGAVGEALERLGDDRVTFEIHFK